MQVYLVGVPHIGSEVLTQYEEHKVFSTNLSKYLSESVCRSRTPAKSLCQSVSEVGVVELLASLFTTGLAT